MKKIKIDTNWSRLDDFEEIYYDVQKGIAKLTINRPRVRNAFTPKTVHELMKAFSLAQNDPSIGVIILTGAGELAFCSGGDQSVRGNDGYKDELGITHLNVLEFQRQIRTCPKPVIAMVAGYAIGGGHVLHMVCDLTIAANNAIFGQTGPKVGSFDGGFGASYMARIVGQKKAREIWFTCRQYNAAQALEMGLVNEVVPLENLEIHTLSVCREILMHSPLALRCLKSGLNADCDGQAGLQQLAGDATMLFYMTDESKEGKRAFLQKRKPSFRDLNDSYFIHNPQCSKSREALALLEKSELKYQRIDYLKKGLSTEILRSLFNSYDGDSLDLLRLDELKKSNLVLSDTSVEYLIKFLSENINFLQRPLLLHRNHCFLLRPISVLKALLL